MLSKTMQPIGSVCINYFSLIFLFLFRFIYRRSTFCRNIADHAGWHTVLNEAEDAETPNSLQENLSEVPLLPQRQMESEDGNKLTVVLDLDETLVCAYTSPGLPIQQHAKAHTNGLRWFPLTCTLNPTSSKKDQCMELRLGCGARQANIGMPHSPVKVTVAGSCRENHVTVYERPGLREFLDKLSEFAEIVLFTASLEGYADPLVDHIDPHHRIQYRLYRTATVKTARRDHVKDLSRLGRDLRRCVLVDNNPFSFMLQPNNGIPCVPFTALHVHDRQLIDVLLPLLRHLSCLEDVRPTLQSHFKIASWFHDRGIEVDSNLD